MAKTIKPNTIVIHCEYLTAQRVRMTARKDITFTSQDGTVKATVKAGETFYLAKSDTHEGFYYLVTSDVNSSTCWRCYCPSYKPCKHEKNVQADNNARFTISPIEAHIKYTAATAATAEAPAEEYSTLTPSQRRLMATGKRMAPQKTLHVSFSGYNEVTGKWRGEEARERAALNGNRGFSLMR